MKNWYLHNGLVYRKKELRQEDVLILNGKIAAFGSKAQRLRKGFSQPIKDFSAHDSIISRGFIDLHVHLREPGFTEKETITTGTQAAAAGGFTSVYAMPNTNPPLDSVERFIEFQKQISASAVVKVRPIGALTKARAGKELVDYAALRDVGVRFFSDDGEPLDTNLVIQAMERLREVHGVLINHLEDKSLVRSGLFHQAIPAESEYHMLRRDLDAVAKTGCAYHAAHLSCFQSVDMIRKAKGQGLPVTAEVTPHHLVLTYDDIQEPQGHFQMKPPLRSGFHREALVEGLRLGIIDIIATDHAPHGREKEGALTPNSPFGVTGLETAFPILYTRLVQTNALPLERLLYCLTTAPAVISGEFRDLTEGEAGDIVVINLNQKRRVGERGFFSKGTNSPFVGEVLKGWPILTLVDGEERYQWDGGC